MFTSKGLSKFTPIIRDSARKLTTLLLERGKTGGEVDVHAPFGEMTLRNILLAAFGIEMDTLLAVSNGKGNPDTVSEDRNAKLLAAIHTVFYTPFSDLYVSKIIAPLP